MKKILIFLLSLSLLGGCAPAKKIHLSEHVTLSFFYIQSCSQCQAFKSVAIPLLEDTYQDQITILQYDLDEPETEAIYDQIIDSLVDFDEETTKNHTVNIKDMLTQEIEEIDIDEIYPYVMKKMFAFSKCNNCSEV